MGIKVFFFFSLILFFYYFFLGAKSNVPLVLGVRIAQITANVETEHLVHQKTDSVYALKASMESSVPTEVSRHNL